MLSEAYWTGVRVELESEMDLMEEVGLDLLPKDSVLIDDSFQVNPNLNSAHLAELEALGHFFKRVIL